MRGGECMWVFMYVVPHVARLLVSFLSDRPAASFPCVVLSLPTGDAYNPTYFPHSLVITYNNNISHTF